MLLLVSSAGFLHGILIAVYLFFVSKKRTWTNYVLGSILVLMAFRIGKSVMLNFGDELEPMFIFAGLAFLLAIGPLLRWYVVGLTRPDFKINQKNLVELVPFLMVFVGSFWVSSDWFNPSNKKVVIVFGSIILFIYLHFAFYIISSGRLWFSTKKLYKSAQKTKLQKSIVQWLGYLIIGFVVIWFSYVLNLIENTVPYIIGPIIYSLIH